MSARLRTIALGFAVVALSLATAAGQADDSAAELSLRARAVLREILVTDRTAAMLHAGDALIAAGDGAQVHEAFKSQWTELAATPRRFGVLRELAITGTSDADRAHYVAEIETELASASSKERTGLLENLCKLHHLVGYRLRPDLIKVAEAGARDPSERETAFPLWALAQQNDAAAVARLAGLLQSPDPAVRILASYALRWLRPGDTDIIRRLAAAADREVKDAPSVSYVLSAALFLDPRSAHAAQWRERLTHILMTGGGNDRYQASFALMNYFGPRDLGPLVPLLTHPDPDARVSAAWIILHAIPLPTTGRAGMVWVPGGEFTMGMSGPASQVCGAGEPDDATPRHRVAVDGFWMDATEVTNDQFADFVRATGYVTVAEQPLSSTEFPQLLPEQRVPGALVFTAPSAPVPLDDYRSWWQFRIGADWRHPEGPGSTIVGRGKFPVVQVAYPDALAYARWSGKRLPTEAEWEFASRGGRDDTRYLWEGDALTPGGKWLANIWQGHFPNQNTGADGFVGLAPVGSYPPNAFGLFDMAGNVWEWCSDWYRPDAYALLGSSVARNPSGPADSVDPMEPGVPKRVQRGGSFLCSDQYCARYLAGARGKGEPSSSTDHLGFRCVAPPDAVHPAPVPIRCPAPAEPKS